MRKLILLAGAAALAGAAPALAKPGGGGGHANGGAMHANLHATAVHSPNVHASGHATTRVRNVHATTHARNVHATSHGRALKISSADQALAHKYGGALCQPGLYKKTPSCMPPGQAKRLFRTGQLVPTRYKYITPFGDIPSALVTQYSLTDQNRYIYRNNVIYVIDPLSNRVTRVINGVL